MTLKKVTLMNEKDTGLLAGIVLLSAGLYTENFIYLKISVIILVLALIFPKVFRYPAVLWFSFSEILGSVLSKIVLVIIYILAVLPVSAIRRLMNKDPMTLRGFGNNKIRSSWINREYEFKSGDLRKPY